jgi:hypothetical protein
MSDNPLRSLAERLASIPSFNIHVLKTSGKTEPWYEVIGKDVVESLIIDETNLHESVTAISAQLAHWGRLEAQTKRVWEVEERLYRVWRETEALEMLTPPKDDKTWKKPPEHQIDATIRTKKKYSEHQERLERAEEAYNATRLIREAFLAKRDMLKLCVIRAPGNSAPRLSV